MMGFLLGVMLLAAGGFYLWKYEEPSVNIPFETVKKKWEVTRPHDSLLHTGDLILRHGRGFISNAFMSFSLRDSKYSHAGIVHRDGDKVFVYHAIGGEENKDNRMRKDLLFDFCDPRYVHSFGIYRYRLTAAQCFCLDSLAGNCYNAGLQFDTHLSMATDDVMYCSELIYKLLPKASGNKIRLSLSRAGGKDYVATDDLYLNEHCRFLYHCDY